MRALCLITVKPGKVDPVVEVLKKKRKVVKQVMVVTGRADISVLLQGNIDEINGMVIDFKKIKEIVTTETLIEVEVNFRMVRAIILVRSPKKLIAARLRKVKSVSDSFPTSGQFDAVAIIDVDQLAQIKEIANEIQKINGVERTETMVEVQ